MAFKVFSDFSVSPLPRVLRIEPASACNLHCVHCPTGRENGSRRGIMPPEVFSRVIGQIESYKGVDVAVLYHGGEPFLNKDLLNMVRRLKSLGVRFVRVVTNGMLIREEILPLIIESGLDNLQFSLDGTSPEENNRIRQGCDYYKVSATIKKLIFLKDKLKQNNPDVCISTVQIPCAGDVTKGVLVSTPEYMLRDFSDFNGKFIFKNTYMIKWPGYSHPKEYRLEEGPLAKGMLAKNYCNVVLEVATIRWNGDVVPCCYDITSAYVAGNIMEQDLAEIWNNEKYRDLRRSIHRREYFELCGGCNDIRHQLYVVKERMAKEGAR